MFAVSLQWMPCVYVVLFKFWLDHRDVGRHDQRNVKIKTQAKVLRGLWFINM